MNMPSYTIITGLICDDIRRETNGKMIALGIFGSRIFLNEFPAFVNLHGLVNVSFAETGPHRIKVRLSVDNVVRSEVEVHTETIWKGADWFPIPFGPIHFDRASVIKLSWETSAGKWKTFTTLPVQLGPTGSTA